jgi:hypothetical protein
MNKSLILLVLILVSFSTVGQVRIKSSSVFISGVAGAAKVNFSGNNDQSPLSFVFGGSFGIPVPFVKNLYLYARTSYTSQSNFQSYYNSSYLNNQINLSEGFTEVNSSFSQLILNGGLLYNFILSDEFTLGINGGLTYMIVNQEAKLRYGRVISSIDNERIWGAFSGLIAEKRWEESNFATFAEAQYNYAESDAFYRPGALSAMNYTFGVRYYFARR